MPPEITPSQPFRPKPLLEEAIPLERAAIYAAIASDLGIPFSVIPKSEITDSFKMPRDGEIRILVEYGDKIDKFFERVYEHFPPPPPRQPMPYSGNHSVRARPIDSSA